MYEYSNIDLYAERDLYYCTENFRFADCGRITVGMMCVTVRIQDEENVLKTDISGFWKGIEIK